jgi:hypothetical protein
MTSRLSLGSGLLSLLLVAFAGTVPAETEDAPEDERSSAEWLGLRKERLSEEERRLLQRPDEKRPAEQYSTDIWGRPLTVGWSYELRTSVLDDVPFKDLRVDDTTRVNQVLTLDFFYRLTETSSLFLRGNAFYQATRIQFADHPTGLEEERDRERGLARDEMWLFLRDIAGSPLSLQIGRQRVSEDREWWWDEDLDAVRMHYDLRKLHLEVGVAQLLTRISTEEPHIEPEEEDVVRFLARGSWEWTRRNRVELFLLGQWDRSGTEPVDLPVEPSREDDSDADLWWLGASMRGGWRSESAGRLDYWLDTALVEGRETSLDYSGCTEVGSGCPAVNRHVGSRSRHGVRGWGFDVGATWEIPLPGRPAFTLGYALGSGDREGKDLAKRDEQRIRDRSFRQTGLQDDNARFRGVDRFKYYGELLDPELSNLHIGTAALGYRFGERNSVEILYHFYRQDEAAKFLRDARIRRQPAGRKRGIGEEIDVVIGIEEWEHIEIELIGAAFRAGPAFAEHLDGDDYPEDLVADVEGEWSLLGLVKFKLNF